MPFAQFDRSQLRLRPLNERVHDVQWDKVAIGLDDPLPEFDDPALPVIAQDMMRAKRREPPPCLCTAPM